MNGGRSIEDLELDLMFIRAMENADFESMDRSPIIPVDPKLK